MEQRDEAWEQRAAQLWVAMDAYAPNDFVARIEALAAELPPGNAIGLFERGCAQDSTGHPDNAVPLYNAAARWWCRPAYGTRPRCLRLAACCL